MTGIYFQRGLHCLPVNGSGLSRYKAGTSGIHLGSGRLFSSCIAWSDSGRMFVRIVPATPFFGRNMQNCGVRSMTDTMYDTLCTALEQHIHSDTILT